MRAEDVREWLRKAELEETQEGYAGAGDNWRLLVRLITTIWETGEIPRQMLWTIVVLTPKGNSGDFRGIGLLEVFWKVIEKVLDARMSSIDLHDCLHGFRGRGAAVGLASWRRSLYSSSPTLSNARCMRCSLTSGRLMMRWTGGAAWRSLGTAGLGRRRYG